MLGNGCGSAPGGDADWVGAFAGTTAVKAFHPACAGDDDRERARLLNAVMPAQADDRERARLLNAVMPAQAGIQYPPASRATAAS